MLEQCETGGWREWSASRAAGLIWKEDGGIRVWCLKSDLEERVGQESVHGFEASFDKQLRARQALARLVEKVEGQVEGLVKGLVEAGTDLPPLEVEGAMGGLEVEERVVAGVDGNRSKTITKPMVFQDVGPEVWNDREPQSHRAQHPWLLAHTREATETVRNIMKTVVDPQVEEIRSHCLVAKVDLLDMRTEYYTVERTGEMEESILVNGRRVEWERLRLVMVLREEGPAYLAKVKVRLTKRRRGFMAGRGGDQARQEDLHKPVLVVGHPCGHNQAISVDFQMAGLDTKMIRMLNQRTGSYCYICKTTKEMAHKIERVKEGFWDDILPMEELITHARELMEATGLEEREWHNYVLVAEKGDAETRYFISNFHDCSHIRLGVKNVPLSTVVDSVSPYAVLHTCLLRLFAFLETLIIR